VKLGQKELGEVTNNSFGRWQWWKVNREPLELPADAATLLIESREDGSRLDEILLTDDLDYVPVTVERAQ
jgi:hypothetical protein